MPLPKPGDAEDRSDWMDRCMGHDTMNSDFPDNKQRAAVCNQIWRDRNKSAMIENRAYSVLQIKRAETQGDLRVIEGIASTPTPDRINDIVEPLGAKFTLPMPLLWQHRAGEPVGTVEFAQPTKDGIPFRARIANIAEAGELKNLVDKAWQSVKAGLVRGVSIGFKTLDREVLKNGGWRIKTWEWVELSLVTIPMNAEATIRTIKSIDAKTLAALGQRRPASSSISGIADQSKGTTNVKTIAEQIEERAEDCATLAKRLEELMTKDDGGELDETEQQELQTVETDLKEATAKLRRLKSVEAALATAKPIDGSDERKGSLSRTRASEIIRPPAEPKQDEKGMGFARKVMCLASANFDPMRAMHIAKQRYPGFDQLQRELKADVAGGTTLDSAWAGALVEPSVLGSEFVEYLNPTTIIGKFGTNGIPSLRRIPFNVKIQEQTSAGSGYWVGEGDAKPLTSFAFTSTTHRWTKVANIAVLSKELIRFSTPSAEALTRTLLAEALRNRLDSDFINPSITLQADVRPASITNGATTAASSAVTAAEVMDDLKTLMNDFISNNISTSSLVWIMRESAALALSLMVNTLNVRAFPGISATGGTLIGFPVITSQHVPSGVVVLVAANEIYLSDDGGVSIQTSDQASLEMSDAPGANVGTGSPPAPVAQTQKVVSMFQTNSVAILAERFINWSRRRGTNGVAYLTSVGWGNTGSSPDGAPI